MSVATKNPFAILDDDVDDRPSTAHTQQHQQQQQQQQPSQPANQKQRSGPASRAGKYYQRGGPARTTPQRDSSAQIQDELQTDSQRKFEGAREGGRGGRGARGARGGPQRGGRRPFDKHSQTGKTDSDKKIHNSWGGDDANAELKTEQAANVDAAAEGADAWASPAQADDAWGPPSADDTAWSAPQADGGTSQAQDTDKSTQDRPHRERDQEEEDNTLTLEQYLQQKKDKEFAAVPKLEVRKANEGADKDIWKGTVPLSKSEEDEAYFVGKAKSAPKARAKKEEKVYLEIDARFDRPERGSRGRGRGGERGGDRGRGERARGRGGPRGGRYNGSNSNPAVNVDDQTAFPSLS